MQLVELALPLAVLAPSCDLLSRLVEFDDAVIGLRAMAVADKVSLLGATTTLLAPLKKPSALPGMPGLPSVISTWPVGLNLTTVPPLPFKIPLSATHTLP